MSEQAECAPQDRGGTAIMYGCEECGYHHFRKFASMFGHYINEIDCPECGHTIRGEYER